jgi:hypothetical protein
VIQEAGPNIERLCDRIDFNVPGYECSLNPHDSRLEHASHLDLQLWPDGHTERHRRDLGRHDSR